MEAPVAPVIVKLGGSVLTRKREAPRVRAKVLDRLAEELSGLPAGALVVLHGAGSYGHPGAVRFHLAEPPGAIPAHERTRGAALVSAEVRRLHGAVLRALLDRGVNAWSVPPATVARQKAGVLTGVDPAAFTDALDRGLVPVAFGDVVPDADWGSSILSADTLALALAPPLHARRVLFVSDVDGVLRYPPGHPGRPEVYPTVDAAILAALHPSRGAPDVTGGIRGKVRTMLELAALGVDAGLISGLRHGALHRAVRGESVYGSWSKPDPR